MSEVESTGDYLMVYPNIEKGRVLGFNFHEFTDEGLFDFFPEYSRITEEDMLHLCVIINTVMEEYIKVKVIGRE